MKATVLKADGHKVELDGSVDEVVACLQALGLSPVQPLAKGVVPGIPNPDGRFPFGPGWGDGLTGPIPVRIVPAEGEELQGCPGVRIIPASTPWNPGPEQPYIGGQPYTGDPVSPLGGHLTIGGDGKGCPGVRIIPASTAWRRPAALLDVL